MDDNLPRTTDVPDRSNEATGLAIAGRGAHCEVDGVRLHYLDFNETAPGTPILILPGITSPAATWAFVARRLATRCRVVVPDIRGRGLSENRPGLGYSLDDYAADARGLIRAVGLERPIVIGHSMGARIAACLGASDPDIASRMILVDPPLSGPGRDPYPTPLASYLTARAAASNGATIEAFREFNPTWTEEQIALRIQWLPSCSIEAIEATYRHFHDEDVFPYFSELSCPTLLLYALRAKVVGPEQAKEIEHLLPAGRAEGIEAGHMVPWDNLEGFIDAVTRFITAHR